MSATIVVSFPLTPDREPERHAVAAGANLAEALMAISPDRWGGLTFELYQGALTPHGKVPIDKAADYEVKDGEQWHVLVCPADPVSGSLVLAVAGALGVSNVVAGIIVYVAITAITMAISYGITMIMARGRASDRQGSSSDQPSSLNSLSPPHNTMRPLSRVPDIYGHMRTWPDLIFNGIQEWQIWGARWGAETEYRMQKHTTSIQSVQAVYCVGRGLYDIHNPRFGDNGIDGWNGTVTRYVPGQTLPASIKLPSPITNISRIELGEAGASNQFTPWFEIPHPHIDEVWAQIQWPGGMYVSITGKKVVPPSNVEGAPSDIRIDGERLDEDGNVVQFASWTSNFIAQTSNELRQTIKIGLTTAGRWRFRVGDTSPPYLGHPNGNSYEANRKAYLEGLVGFATLDADDRTFEEETVLVVTCSNQGGTASQNIEEFNVDAHRILPTHAAGPPGTLTDAVDDPRWITAAINTAIDPKICNYTSEQIDWSSLIEVQQALESYPEGWTEENFNGVFDRQMSADEQLQAIAKKARAVAFMSGGRLTFARDQRREGVCAIFNRRNRLADRGDLGIGLRFPGPDEYDGVEITYFDETDEYRQKTYSYPEGVSLINPLAIDLVGATRAYEVCRRARFEFAVQQYRRRTQPLRVTEEAQLLLPYDRVAIVAPWDEGVIDGEVLEVDSGTNEYRLDRPIPLGLPETARIRLRRDDGRETSLHEVAQSGRGVDWCVVSPPPTFTVVVPGDDKQLGTLYNLSRDDAYDAATQWLVSGAEIDDRGVMLSLMEDADEVYQLSDDLLDPCTDTPVDCEVTLAFDGPAAEFIPLWVADPGFPDDKISPTFGTWEQFFDWFEPTGANSLTRTASGKLVGAFYYWDWDTDPSSKFEGQDVVATGDGDTSGFNGSEIVLLADGRVYINQGSGAFTFDEDGNLLSGPRYFASFNNTPFGDVGDAVDPEIVYSLVNAPSALTLVKRNIGEPTDAITTVASVVVMNASGTPPISGGSAYTQDGRLLRSGGVIAACLVERVGASFPYEFPLRIMRYNSSLTHLGTTDVAGDITAYPLSLGWRLRPTGGFAVMFANELGFDAYPTVYEFYIRLFAEDGSAEGPAMSLGTADEDAWWGYPMRWPNDFGLSDDERYLVLTEAQSELVGGDTLQCRQRVTLFDLSGGSANLMATVDVEPGGFDPPEQDRLLDARLHHDGGDTFTLAFQRYVSADAKPNGGETPVWKRTFTIQRCP